MKNQPLTPRERLQEWANQNKKQLGETFVEEATEIAQLCYLAFDVFEKGDKLETDFPRQAVISETKFGSRPRHRPPTSQPAAYAGYYLEQQYGTARDVIHEFIEALTARTFEQSELRKLMKPIRQRLTEAAKATGDCILGRLTAETLLQEQTAEVERLCSDIDEATNSYTVRHLRQLLEQRLALFPRIKSGEFDALPPLMLLSDSTHLGKATLSGPMMQAGGSTVRLPIPPLPSNLPLRGAYILGVPGWYPYWRGGYK